MRRDDPFSKNVGMPLVACISRTGVGPEIHVFAGFEVRTLVNRSENAPPHAAPDPFQQPKHPPTVTPSGLKVKSKILVRPLLAGFFWIDGAPAPRSYDCGTML